MLSFFKKFTKNKPQSKRSQSAGTQYIEGLLNKESVVSAESLSAVIAAISNISETIASLPLNIYEIKGANRHIAHTHPLYKLIRFAPNATMTPYTLFEAFVKCMLIYGNGFIYPIKNRKGEIIELKLIDEIYKLSLSKNEAGQYYYIYTGSKGSVFLNYDEILNVPYHTQDGITGIAPLRKSKNTLKLAALIEEHGLKFFENGVFSSGILESEKALSDEGYERLKNSFQKAYSGTNAHKTILLEEGVKFVPTTSANKDAQFLETKSFQIIEIARLFNIPPHKLGDLSRATFSNIEQQELNYMVQTITPLTTKIEQALNRFLLRKDEWGRFYFKFNINAILRADSASRWDSYVKALQNGVMNVNEVRGLEELNPIKNGDFHLQAVNLTQLGNFNHAENNAKTLPASNDESLKGAKNDEA